VCVYKVDYLILRNLLSFFVLLNIEVIFCLYLRIEVIISELNIFF